MSDGDRSGSYIPHTSPRARVPVILRGDHAASHSDSQVHVFIVLIQVLRLPRGKGEWKAGVVGKRRNLAVIIICASPVLLSLPARALHALHLLLSFVCVFVCFAMDQVDRRSHCSADGPMILPCSSSAAAMAVMRHMSLRCVRPLPHSNARAANIAYSMLTCYVRSSCSH